MGTYFYAKADRVRVDCKLSTSAYHDDIRHFVDGDLVDGRDRRALENLHNTIAETFDNGEY